jgi:PAS domain S-box-containing protein
MMAGAPNPFVRENGDGQHIEGALPSDNVAYAVASPSERRLALFVAIGAALFAAAIAPFGHVQATEVVAFLPTVTSASVVTMGLTASLLFAQYRAGGFAPLAILALAYAAASVLMLTYLLTFPNVFSPTGLLGAGPQTAAWLFVGWPFLFCALIAVYLVVERGENPPRLLTVRRVTLGTGTIVVVAILATTLGNSWLPGLIEHQRMTAFYRHVIAPMLLIVLPLTNLFLIWKTRLRARCHLWLAVVLAALFIEIVMVAFESGGRFTYGWYFARAELALVATVFLIMLQMQYMSILRRVSVSNVRLEQRNAEVEHLVELQKYLNVQLTASEARYHALTDAMPQLVWTVDATGALRFANARWSAYTGLPSTGAQSLGFMLDAEPFDEVRGRGDTASPAEFECEARLRRNDGTYRWHLVRAVPFHEAARSGGEWILTATDIEARRAAEAELAGLHATALAATQSKSRFLATMSHEIRTPMNGVIGMTELLLLTSLDGEQLQYARAVHDSGRSLLRLINDILDYSKVEAGKLELETVAFELGNELDSVLRLLRPQFESKGVSLASRIEPNVPPKLVGDAGRIRQILINLIGNALKFTPSGGAVRVVVALDGHGNGFVPIRFGVEDTGIGISPDVLDRLFQPFAQGDGTITRKYGGTGLGLSICAQLVTLMRGAIGVESEPGVGSSFWFLVPLAPLGDSEPPEATRGPVGDALEARLQSARAAKILLVEDNDINTRLAIAQFKQMGFELSVAVNGRFAVEAVERENFDLVFMDCHMPEMDGFAATREIRLLETGTARRVPIVAMTADAREEDAQRCISAGMDDFLSKPTSLGTLRPVIDRWLPAFP